MSSSVRRTAKKILAHALGAKMFCPVCRSKVKKFDMLPEKYLKDFETSLFPHSIFAFETLNVTQYECPICSASDRARLYKLYLEKVGLRRGADGKASVLDIAPDPHLSAYLKSLSFVNYRSADISGRNVDDKIDITSMSIYEDNRFDFILCSHVLEHVSDDLKAMKELVRVLRPGGTAIVMVPILLSIQEIDEDDTVTSAAGRMARFGQDDHVRLYSKNGFLSRLRQAGFIPHQYGVEYFGSENFRRHGINDRSVLYVVEKVPETKRQ